MMNRRRFLSTGMIGAGLAGTSTLAAASLVKPAEPVATLNIFDEKWAKADLEVLGIPKSWWHVHQGVFPFAPERVLVIKKRPDHWAFRPLKERLLEDGVGGTEYFSEEKLDYAIWITHMLAKCYHVPEYSERWATKLSKREDLGMGMAIAQHIGYVHQFQYASGPNCVPTTNGAVDWWLVLIPDGVDFQSLDDLPTHVLFGLVIADYGKDSHLYCHWGGCLNYLIHSEVDWIAVSQMDRLSAARYLNRRLAEAM